jgi:RimJ/RimL family protein N-acetyltransferase
MLKSELKYLHQEAKKMDGKEIYLKEIEIEDAEFLHNLFQCKEYAQIFYEESTTIEEWTNRIHKMKENNDKNQYIVRLKGNDIPIGWVGYFEEENDKDVECLQILIIDISYLRLGYGTDIMKILKKTLSEKGKRKIRLSTQETNKRAQSFYLKHGFSIIGSEMEEVDWGRKIEKFVIMECAL